MFHFVRYKYFNSPFRVDRPSASFAHLDHSQNNNGILGNMKIFHRLMAQLFYK